MSDNRKGLLHQCIFAILQKPFFLWLRKIDFKILLIVIFFFIWIQKIQQITSINFDDWE